MFVQQVIVQQAMLYVQVQLPHVAVQEVGQSLIVLHVLTIHMVYAVIQSVVVILAPKCMIMVLLAPPVTLVAVALVLHMCQLDLLASIAQPHTIAATDRAIVQLQHMKLVLIARAQVRVLRMCVPPMGQSRAFRGTTQTIAHQGRRHASIKIAIRSSRRNATCMIIE